MRGRRAWVTGRPFPTGALTKSKRSESLNTVNKFAAFAVSITLPPPTLFGVRFTESACRAKYVREEMAEIVCARPCDGVAPAVLGRFGDDTIVHLERQILLRVQ